MQHGTGTAISSQAAVQGLGGESGTEMPGATKFLSLHTSPYANVVHDIRKVNTGIVPHWMPARKSCLTPRETDPGS